MIESGERTDGRDGIIIKESEEGRVLSLGGMVRGLVITHVCMSVVCTNEPFISEQQHQQFTNSSFTNHFTKIPKSTECTFPLHPLH